MRLTTVKNALSNVITWAGLASFAVFVLLFLFMIVDGIVIGDTQVVGFGFAGIVLLAVLAGIVLYECDIL